MAISTDISATLGGLIPAQPPLVGAATGFAATTAASKAKAESRVDPTIFDALIPLATIQGSVADGLQASIRDASGRLQAYTVQDKASAQIQQLLGKPNDPATIGRSFQAFAEAFAKLAAQPNQSAAGAVQAATQLTQKLSSTTTQIQGLRGQADQQLGVAVGQANSLLRQIADANQRIAVGAVNGISTKILAQDRDTALDNLAGLLNIGSFARTDGTASVFAGKNTQLVGDGAATLGYTPATTAVDPSMSLAGGSLSGLTVNGADIGGELSTGRIPALLQLRDGTLPDLQSQVDTLAQTLQSRVNQAANRALAGPAARASYSGSRSFPADQRIALSGGDTVVSLQGADGKTQTETSLSMLMKQYRQANGLPTGGTWPIGQIGGALNGWLGSRLGVPAAQLAKVDADGRLSIQLPTAGMKLAFRDRQSGAYQSALAAAPDKPLGLTGPLTFTDGAGNLLSTGQAQPPLNIAPADSLSSIAAKLNALGGLTATLVASDGGDSLRVSSHASGDMTLEPDRPGSTVVAGLGLAPAADQPVQDVGVNLQSSTAGASLTSAAVPNADMPLGTCGVLTLQAPDGSPIARLQLDKGSDLQSLATDINRQASDQGITAAVTAVGNQVALRISAPIGRQVSLAGAPESYQASAAADFSAAGGVLSITVGGNPAGRLTVKPGATLQNIAQAINDPAGPFAGTGVAASLAGEAGGATLEIAGPNGQPLGFGGTAVGTGPGQLQFGLNPRDALGFTASAGQVVLGFANVLGLNDIFVADPPDAFDSKAPTGLFTSTAAPGTAQALAVNPSLGNNPGQLDPTTVQRVADLLSSPVTIAAAGGLARGSYGLGHYAETIANVAAAKVTDARNGLAYQRVLVDGLNNQKAGLGGMEMNDHLANLNTYQQAYQDSAQVVSSMPQLLDRLGITLQ